MKIKGCREEATYKLMGNLIICISKTLRQKNGNVLLCYFKIFIFFKALSHRRDLGTKITAKTRPQISENDKNERTVFGEDPGCSVFPSGVSRGMEHPSLC